MENWKQAVLPVAHSTPKIKHNEYRLVLIFHASDIYKKYLCSSSFFFIALRPRFSRHLKCPPHPRRRGPCIVRDGFSFEKPPARSRRRSSFSAKGPVPTGQRPVNAPFLRRFVPCQPFAGSSLKFFAGLSFD